MEPLSEVTLETVGGGAAVELFEREFTELLKNIQDPNREAKAKRTVVIKVTVEPEEDREQAVICVAAESKLAPHRPVVSQIYMGRKDGRYVAVSYDPRQSELFGTGEAAGVTPIERRTEQA